MRTNIKNIRLCHLFQLVNHLDAPFVFGIPIGAFAFIEVQAEHKGIQLRVVEFCRALRNFRQKAAEDCDDEGLIDSDAPIFGIMSLRRSAYSRTTQGAALRG